MAISAFDLFTIGVGPSSSHTVGPMRAALQFASQIEAYALEGGVGSLRVELFGSLGATGRGHGTDKAVLMGLEGEAPESVDPYTVPARAARIAETKALHLLGKVRLTFDPLRDLVFHRRRSLAFHPNGMRFRLTTPQAEVLLERTYYSIGGGFVVDEGSDGSVRMTPDQTPLPYPFHSGEQLLALCAGNGLSISGLMMANECQWRGEAEVRAGLLAIWQVMQDCVDRGCRTEGVLPGGMKVRRRAAAMKASLAVQASLPRTDPLVAMDWVNLFALAVNEENAAGGRVVTAPTNGAAGIVPAVLHYYWHFVPGANADGVVDFLLTAAAVGVLFKENASISGAEVGCQGEVGSACAMAAAGLAEVMGGSPAQVENAAEIGMEHNLGLTCDPVGGLVQVPCIERNAIAAVKAISAARMALRGDGQHFVSLDKVIKTMRDTGADMKTKYKETARGGLAVNVVEC